MFNMFASFAEFERELISERRCHETQSARWWTRKGTEQGEQNKILRGQTSYRERENEFLRYLQKSWAKQSNLLSISANETCFLKSSKIK
jgi:DNA invertase Pin-like site-specific DNA recombinase